MPYKDNEKAKECWRRRNAKPERKAYMLEFVRERRKDPEVRKRANAVNRKWQKEPENLVARADYQRQRRAQGIVKAGDLRNKEALAGRPRPTFCEACGRLPNGRGNLHFDHCHRLGHFRGWLCHNCNIALGLVNDDAQILRKLIAYLQRTKKGIAPQLAFSGI